MKTIKTILIINLICLSFLAFNTSCKKKKGSEPSVENPTPPAEENEVITTVKLYLTDSITNTTVIKTFKDPDGEGSQPGVFLNSGADSVFLLSPNRTYFCKVYILDETKSPVDSVSNAIAGSESYLHMLFYNGNPSATGNYANSILTAAPNYAVKLNGSDVKVNYLDLDNGPAHSYAQRNIGLYVRLRTANAMGASVKFPFVVTLRHQPGSTEGTSAKDGTYAPGSSDVEVGFKVSVN